MNKTIEFFKLLKDTFSDNLSFSYIEKLKNITFSGSLKCNICCSIFLETSGEDTFNLISYYDREESLSFTDLSVYSENDIKKTIDFLENHFKQEEDMLHKWSLVW